MHGSTPDSVIILPRTVLRELDCWLIIMLIKFSFYAVDFLFPAVSRVTLSRSKYPGSFLPSHFSMHKNRPSTVRWYVCHRSTRRQVVIIVAELIDRERPDVYCEPSTVGNRHEFRHQTIISLTRSPVVSSTIQFLARLCPYARKLWMAEG